MKLYLQGDNCAGENKNKWLFGILAYLVHLGWFVEIHYYYLMVGHTHTEMLDGAFGTIRVVSYCNAARR